MVTTRTIRKNQTEAKSQKKSSTKNLGSKGAKSTASKDKSVKKGSYEPKQSATKAKSKKSKDPVSAFKAMNPASQIVFMPRFYGIRVIYTGTLDPMLMTTMQTACADKGFSLEASGNSINISIPEIYEEKEIINLANGLANIAKMTPYKMKTKVRTDALKMGIPGQVLMGTAQLTLME